MFAAALTEPLSCISHGWDRIAPIPVGSRILILGAGIIGNLWASVLHLQGHRRVIISEPQETRRKLAMNLGKPKDKNSVYIHILRYFNASYMSGDIKESNKVLINLTGSLLEYDFDRLK
jgi:hypothetical protein